MSDMTPETPRNVAYWAQNLPLPVPRNQREVFQLLAEYKSGSGIDTLLNRVGFAGVTRVHVVQAVLGRAPESVEAAIDGDGFNPGMFFQQCLLSTEFRNAVVPAFLRAFPELARDVFVHVPKCAGTDLVINIGRRQMPLPSILASKGWIPDDEYLSVLGGLASALRFHDRIFVYGHMILGEYVAAAGIRPMDRVFSIIRDPVELMVSQANYAVGRLRQDPAGQDPDTAELFRHLQIARLPDPLRDRDLKDLAVRALLHPDISPPNRACLHLGLGKAGNFDETIEQIIVHNVELTTTQHYDRWLNERWNIPLSARHNRSDTILTLHEARRFFADSLFQATAEDQKLFDLVSWAIDKAGTSSVTGSDIVRITRPDSAKNVAEILSKELQPIRDGGALGLFVVQEPHRVARYLHLPSEFRMGTVEPEEVLAVDFGSKGTGEAYQISGWANAEERFTWTDGFEARLRLPPCPRGGAYVVRLIGTPFVVRTQLPEQRIEVVVNRQSLGCCTISNFAVLEFEIPPSMTTQKEPLEITLLLPSAACPRPLNGAADDRLLGLAVEMLTLTYLRPRARAG